jgi:hypothetical protein
MRNLIILILLIGGAAKVSADCTQNDLAGWWQLDVQIFTCNFLLDEEGTITKGNCAELPNDPDSEVQYKMRIKNGTEANDRFSIESTVLVGDHCKASGDLLVGEPLRGLESGYWGHGGIFRLRSGRINIEKNIVWGTATITRYFPAWDGTPGKSHRTATFSMIKF